MRIAVLEKFLYGVGFLALVLATATLPSRADNPTFFFSDSASCAGPLSSLEASTAEPFTVYVCVDADNEGDGLLGADVHVTYPSEALQMSVSSCSLFDSCINLSEEGTIKLLGASGPLPDGSAATTQLPLASVQFEATEAGSYPLNFVKAQVIDENQAISSRNGLSITLEVAEAEEIEEEEEEEEEIVEEPVEEEEIVEETPSSEGLSSLVIDPVSQTAAPGDVIQIVATAHYSGGRSSENVTSCFSCPTPGNPDVNGTTSYEIISGPGTMNYSKVVVSPSAVNGEVIAFRATFTDNISLTEATSASKTITVSVPPEPVTEEPEEEEEEIEEPVEPEAAEFHEAAVNLELEAEIALAGPLQEDSPLEVPTAPDDDFCLTNYLASADSDQDGLSDRTECYLKTDPENPDTDGDSCWDGDELNHFYTSPLVPGDCSLAGQLNEVLITDPKPNWIITQLEVTGLAPVGSEKIGVTAFPALHSSLTPVLDQLSALSALIQKEDTVAEDLTAAIETLRESASELASYLEASGSREDLTELTEQLLSFLQTDPSDMLNAPEEASSLLGAFSAYKTEGIFLGEVTEPKEVGLGNNRTTGFTVVPETMPEDGVYDLVAVALQKGGSVLRSAPVRVILDSTFDVQLPHPQTLDGLPILEEHLSLPSISGLELSVRNGRPVLAGQSVYGARVFATWESLVLASSIIADSAEGSFEVQAPQLLDRNEDHQVSLYAVTQLDEGKVRSEDITVHFRVEDRKNSFAYWLILLIALLAVAAMVAKRRLVKIDHLPPEHRAKEDELYEAFGELHIPHEEPADHLEKQKEVETAFSDMEEKQE